MRFLVALFLIFFLSSLVAQADRATSTSFTLDSAVINGGSNLATSSNFRILNSIGQQAVGISTSTSFTLLGGFLYFPVVLEVVTTTTSPSVGPVAVVLNFFDSLLGKILPSKIKSKKLFLCGDGDLNCDQYVDLIDISILFYWWDKKLDKTQLASLGDLNLRDPDLNSDGYIDIIDASVLLKYWTG